MKIHHYSVLAACLCLLLSQLTGCTVLDRLRTGLPQPATTPQETEAGRQSPPPAPLVQPELYDLLRYANRISGLSDQWQADERHRLTAALEENDNDSTRIQLLILQLAAKQPNPAKARQLLKPLLADPREQNPELRGLIQLLHLSLRQQQALHDKLATSRAENHALGQQLAASQKRSDEMAQKLQKLIDIEKIIDQRQKQKK